MKRSRLYRWAAVLPAIVVALLASEARADEVTDWHGHMLTTLVTAGSNPIVCTRDGALVSAAVFDAVNGIERRYTQIHVTDEAPRAQPSCWPRSTSNGASPLWPEVGTAGRRASWRESRTREVRVSSQAMRSAARRISIERGLASARLPIGVATT